MAGSTSTALPISDNSINKVLLRSGLLFLRKENSSRIHSITLNINTSGIPAHLSINLILSTFILRYLEKIKIEKCPSKNYKIPASLKNVVQDKVVIKLIIINRMNLNENKKSRLKAGSFDYISSVSTSLANTSA
jgi:hypothetical protein